MIRFGNVTRGLSIDRLRATMMSLPVAMSSRRRFIMTVFPEPTGPQMAIRRPARMAPSTSSRSWRRLSVSKYPASAQCVTIPRRMGRPEGQIHDAGINRSHERQYNRRAA